VVHNPASRTDYINLEVTVENFLDAVKNLPSDDNDIVFIYYGGHGTNPLLSDGKVLAEDFNKALSSIEYGRLIYFQCSCSVLEDSHISSLLEWLMLSWQNITIEKLS